MSFLFYKEIIIKARFVAIKALDEIINKNLFSNEVISSLVNDVEESEHNFLRQLIYGVLENKIYIDYMLQKISKIKLDKLDKNVLNILRIGIYELKYLNSKKYAVINEAVDNTKKFNFGAKGFVNGVLRNFDRNIEKVSNIDINEINHKLSIEYSCDISIVKYLKKYYKNYIEIIKSFNQVPSFSIRVNTHLIKKEELKKRLEKLGFVINNSIVAKDCLIIENPKRITDLDEFKNGFFTIQDQSSILVSEVLNPKEDSNVLDLCAAPGSKSTHLLQIMNDKGKIISNDIAYAKIEKIEENFNRLNLQNYVITNYDATKEIEIFLNNFDYILVDAPCSGIGVIKRKPEIKLNKSLDDILSLSKIQKDILENAYKYLKSGGKIVYSTCTLGDLENKDIVNNFLLKHKDMEICEINGKKFLEILPDKDNDGFFISSMIKK